MEKEENEHGDEARVNDAKNADVNNSADYVLFLNDVEEEHNEMPNHGNHDDGIEYDGMNTTHNNSLNHQNNSNEFNYSNHISLCATNDLELDTNEANNLENYLSENYEKQKVELRNEMDVNRTNQTSLDDLNGDASKNEPTNKQIEIEKSLTIKFDDVQSSDLKYLFKNTRYFLIKSNNYENVNLAKQKSVWSTPRVNELKLNQAYKECANVLLIFSVSESGRFQGYARLSSECLYEPDLQINWILPPSLSSKSLMGVFKIDWITKSDLNFVKTQHLLNPWNEYKQVKIGRDGQEIEPHCGEMLCRLFDLSETPNIIQCEHMSEEELKAEREKSLNECSQNLNMILEKSKQRHTELANQADQKLKRHSSSHSPKEADDTVDSGNEDKRSTTSNDSASKQRHSASSTDVVSKALIVNGEHRPYKPYNKPYYNNHSSNRRTYNNPNYNYTTRGNYTNPQQMMMSHPNMQQGPGYSYMTQSHTHYKTDESSVKKRRLSPKYLPLHKEIVMHGTYEEYLAAASAMQHQQGPIGMMSEQAFYQSNHGMLNPTVYNNTPVYGYMPNPSHYIASTTTSSGDHSVSKYDKDVEEFLKKSSSAATKGSSKERDRERERDRNRDESYRKDKDRERERERDKDRDRRHHQREHRSKSRDRTSRHKSRDRP